MKRVFTVIAMWWVGALLALGHVGSPNVFFEGRAGECRTFVVIRPPAALPGIAQVSVRVDESDIRAVTLLPVLWPAGERSSPEAVIAQRVAGETNLWSAEVWFLQPGSYTVEIGITGTHGTGQAIVPMNVMGWQAQAMSSELRLTLSLLGLLLLVGAVIIGRAVVRDGRLEIGQSATVNDFRRGRRAGVVVLLFVMTGMLMGAVRWRNMDLAYRTQGLQKPEPVAARVRNEGQRAILELHQTDESAAQSSWVALVPDHGKLMHLFLVREMERDVFAHLHPVRTDAKTFGLELPAFPAGRYELYGDITFENGGSQTLIAKVDLPQPRGNLLAMLQANGSSDVICGLPQNVPQTNGVITRDPDDSWHVERARAVTQTRKRPTEQGGVLVSPLMGGFTLLFENAGEVATRKTALLRFAAFTADGREAPLQMYMGMPGHAAVRRVDGSVFAHLHPAGNFSMASYELFRLRDAADGNQPMAPARVSHQVAFPYEFPKPGAYRIWVQVSVGGRVLTGVFDLEVI